jgi:predicted TIM-barrel fold metal-dependent hydrolase
MELPRIISVDDHIVEPPDLFEGRLAKAFADRAPRVFRKKLRFVGGTKGREWIEDAKSGQWCDAWQYEDLVMPLHWLIAAIGRDVVDIEPTTYDEIRPGAWKQAERLADMTDNHVEAALCFPNLFRFAGQTFSEGRDKALSLACIQAYNDWLIEDWGGGEGKGRLLPVTILPLWDPNLAHDEIIRCAAKGSFFVTFPENPFYLGFPSLYSPKNHWSPIFSACEDTGTILNMHIGSSSRLAETTPDSPYIVSSSQIYLNSQGSLLDFIFSGTLDQHPSLRISYSEGQVGWLPYLLERADKLWTERGDNEFGSSLSRPPSEYIPQRVYFCIFDDEIGLRLRDIVGMDQILFETDYPHADSTFPHTKETLSILCQKAGMSNAEAHQLARGNAIRALQLDRYGIAA